MKHLFQQQKTYSIFGFLSGFLLGLGDYLIFRAIGVEMLIKNEDVTFGVAFFFALNFAALGTAIGQLLYARKEISQQTKLIKAQYLSLEKTQEKLIHTEKLAAVGRLASGVAHEVRNPLGVIRTSAKMILEDLPQNSDARQATDFICEEVDRLNDFVSRLLDFTKPLVADKKTFSLDELGEQLQILTTPRCAEKNISLLIEFEKQKSVYADIDLLCQLLLALIDNSIHAVENKGSICVQANVKNRKNTQLLLIKVLDNGPGILEIEQTKVFEPFFTTKPSGTGLGLAIADKIAEVHKATLYLEIQQGLGKEGTGACFVLEVPI